MSNAASKIILSSLELQSFRNHSARAITFDQPCVLIAGPNASGKTSIIEAVQLLASGESFRAGKVEEMVAFGQELARIKAVVETPEEPTELEIMVTRGLVQGKRAASRLYSINQVRRRKKDFLGQLFAVSFRPEDMRLIEGSPGRRRQFMDTPLAMVSPAYAHSLKTYDQALRKRNKLLLAVREHEMPQTVLHYWNLQLIKHGQVLQEHRRELLAGFAGPEFPLQFSVEYQPSLISEQRIAEYQSRAIAAGHTLVGPHKDDLTVELTPTDKPDFNVAVYGSRGQQRMAVLWLKVCELAYLTSKTDQPPLLLLDDILSELDHDMQSLVLSLLQNRQSIVTTTDPAILQNLNIPSSDYQSILF
jgi:DNA replication and repair protein RecF